MKKEFRINKDRFDEVKKETILRTIPTFVALTAVIFLTNMLNSGDLTRNLDVLFIVLPFILVVMSIGTFWGLRKQKASLESYRIHVGRESVERILLNTPALTIAREDIKSIIKSSSGSIMIKGISKKDIIYVPPQINDFDKLLAALSELQVITYKDETGFEKNKSILTFGALGLMAVLYISQNKLLVGITGTMLLLILSYSLYEIMNNKSVSRKTKKSMWMTLFVFIAIVGIMLLFLYNRFNICNLFVTLNFKYVRIAHLVDHITISI